MGSGVSPVKMSFGPLYTEAQHVHIVGVRGVARVSESDFLGPSLIQLGDLGPRDGSSVILSFHICGMGSCAPWSCIKSEMRSFWYIRENKQMSSLLLQLSSVVY